MIGKILHWARLYYDEETYFHVCRVAEYVTSNKAVPRELLESCYIVAIANDLIEDTDFDIEDFRLAEEHYYGTSTMTAALELLTHKKEEETYEEYIKKIPHGSIAYWVKMADMKDHLALTETLTEKRKEKYLRGLAILL